MCVFFCLDGVREEDEVFWKAQRERAERRREQQAVKDKQRAKERAEAKAEREMLRAQQQVWCVAYLLAVCCVCAFGVWQLYVEEFDVGKHEHSSSDAGRLLLNSVSDGENRRLRPLSIFVVSTWRENTTPREQVSPRSILTFVPFRVRTAHVNSFLYALIGYMGIRGSFSSFY